MAGPFSSKSKWNLMGILIFFQINALMHALIDLRKKNPNIKSLVVSQFTTFLSLIETPLR